MKISYTEKKVMEMIWENEPVRSRDVVKHCKDTFDWKPTTVFTFLKRLGDKGIINNNDSIITSLVSKEEIEQESSNEFIQSVFSESLPSFLAAFLHGKQLSEEESNELIKLIEAHKEKKDA